MSKFHQERLNVLIKQNLSKIVRFDLRDKRVKNITIEKVDVSPDMHYATIYFSIFGDKERKYAHNGLNRAKKYIRMRLAKTLNLRYTPELNFVYDNIPKDAHSIELLIEKERKKYED